MKLCSLSVLLCMLCLHGVYGQTMDQGLADSEGSAYDLSGSGMNSGDGSGDGGCTEPQYRPPPPENTQKEMVTQLRCHLACVERVASAANISIELDRTYPMWPALPSDVLTQDCTIYQKIQECRTGCTEHGMSSGTTITRCPSLCSRRCLLECDGELSCEQTGSQCQRVCSHDYCEIGCQLYEEEIEQGSPSNDQLPLAPREAPRLQVPDNPHPSVYRVKVSNTTQGVTSPDSIISIATTFIFRILHTRRNIVTYFWLPTLNDLLDLVSFACDEDVVVQYAAVNKYGATQFSSPTMLNVYGVLVPTDLLPQNPEPDSISFNVSADLRPKFWKHALIQVSWQLPPAVDTLSHFVVTLHGHTSLCGSRDHSVIVSKDRTSAWLAARTPHDGPVGGCDYKISVSSQSTNGAYIPEGRRNIVGVKKQDIVPVPLNFQCEWEWNQEQGTFQFHLSWFIPDSEHLRDAIRHFQVRTALVSMENNDNAIITDVPYMTEQTDYSHSTNELPFGPAGSYYRTTMITTSSHSNEIVIPDLRECQFDALPLPPVIIDDITITSEDITFIEVKEDLLGGSVGVVRVWISWGRPEGSEGVYEVRVTEYPAVSGENGGEEFTFQQFNVTDAAVRVPVLMELPANVQNTCAYVQVRSKSVFDAVSDWSTPTCIAFGEWNITTTTEVGPTTSPTSSTGLSVEVLYIIVGLGVVMLLAVVIMGVCVMVACVKNRRYRKSATVYLETDGSLKDSLDDKPLEGENFHMIPLLSEDSWELHPKDVIIETKLGHGAFGDVYQGLLKTEGGKEETDGQPEMSNVAVKMLKSSSDELERQSFLDHIEQTKLVSNQSCNAGEPGTHVVRMIGYITTKDPCCLVSELPSKGDLLTYLQHQRALIVDGAKHIEVTSEGLVKFAEQIAVGMEFLSSIGVVHGDLACRNMYLDHNLHLKISDFGLSGSKQKAKPRAYHRTIDGRLPMRWMAMESLEEGLFSTASDVWGFGVTVWEIATLGGFPYSTVSHKELVAHLEIGERLEKPPNCSQELYDLMSSCWAEETLERPSFTELRESIQQLKTEKTPSNLMTLNIDSKLPYYNVVLSNSQTSTPEHSANGGGDGGTGNHWQRIGDKVGDRSYPLSNQMLPSIVEDEQEDLDQLQSLRGYLGEKTRPHTHTKQTIIVEMYENDNGSTGSENEGAENLSECAKTATPDLESGSPSPETASSDLESNSPNLSEELNSQVTEKCDLSITNEDNVNSSNGVSHDTHVICEEIELCPSSTDL